MSAGGGEGTAGARGTAGANGAAEVELAEGWAATEGRGRTGAGAGGLQPAEKTATHKIVRTSLKWIMTEYLPPVRAFNAVG